MSRDKVDPALWMVIKRRDGREMNVLTDAGRNLAFGVGAGMRRGSPAVSLLQALAEAGGSAEVGLDRYSGFGAYSADAWEGLREKGYVIFSRGNVASLTVLGEEAATRGYEAQANLLDRIDREYPAGQLEAGQLKLGLGFGPGSPEPPRVRPVPVQSIPSVPVGPPGSLAPGDLFVVTKGSKAIGVPMHHTGKVKSVTTRPGERSVAVRLWFSRALDRKALNNEITLYAAHANRLADDEVALLNGSGDRILVRRRTR
jgi:hypothetical protein